MIRSFRRHAKQSLPLAVSSQRDVKNACTVPTERKPQLLLLLLLQAALLKTPRLQKRIAASDTSLLERQLQPIIRYTANEIRYFDIRSNLGHFCRFADSLVRLRRRAANSRHRFALRRLDHHHQTMGCPYSHDDPSHHATLNCVSGGGVLPVELCCGTMPVGSGKVSSIPGLFTTGGRDNATVAPYGLGYGRREDDSADPALSAEQCRLIKETWPRLSSNLSSVGKQVREGQRNLTVVSVL